MADLGNLWFSLGLDDSKLEKQWKDALAKYEKKANVNVRLAISKMDFKQFQEAEKKLNKFKNNFSGNIKGKIDLEITQRTLDSLKALQSMGGSVDQWKAIQQAAKAAGQLAKDHANVTNTLLKGQQGLTKEYKNQSLWLENLRNIASNYLSLYTVKNFVTELATVSGEFEKQRITLQAMVGEMEGLEIYGKMKELAVVSPFEFKDLSAYAKQLAAFSVPYEELYDTTKRLADVSAGLGVDMSRIILAYGQIRSAGVLKGTELRQLTEAGVPILDKLAKKFTELEGRAVSVGDVFSKISQKMVPFEMVKDIFTEMTSAGGKFYRMQEIQADTLAGKISNLKDAYAIMLSEIGSTYDNFLKGGVDKIYKLIENWETLGGIIATVFTTFASFQTVKIASWFNQQYKGVKKLATAYLDLVQKGKGAASIFTAIPKSIGWGGILISLVGIGTALGTMWVNAQRVNREMEGIASQEFANLSKELNALDDLVEAIKETTEGTRQRKELIDQLNTQYGSYIGNILDEYSALKKVEQAHLDIKTALKERAKEESLIKTTKVIEDEYTKGLGEAIGVIISRLEESGVDADMATSIAAKIREEMEKNANTLPEDLFASIEKQWKGAGEKAQKALAYTDNLRGGAISYRGIEQLVGVVNSYNRQMDRMKKINRAMFEDSSINWEFIREKTKAITEAYNKILSSITGTDEEAEEQLRKAKIGYLNQLIALYPKASTTAAQYRKELEKLMVADKKWRGDIEDILGEFNIPLAFAPKEDESFLEYIERIREEYKKLKESLKDLTVDPEGIKPGIEAKIKAFEAVAKEFKFSLDEKADNKAQQELLKKQREEVEKLKTQYNSLLAVYKAFINLRNKTGDEGIAGRAVATEFEDYKDILLKALSEGGIEEYFTKTFTKISDEALAKGGDFGKNFVEGMKSTLNTLGTKDVVDAIGIGKELVDKLKSWGMEDFMLQGSGVSLDISKILKAQAEADNKALAKAQEVQDMINKASTASESEKAAMREVIINDIAEKEMLSDEQVAELKKKNIDDIFAYAIERANELAQLEGENNKKVAQEKINDLGKAYAKEMIEDTIGQGAMENLSEKTYSELKALQTELTGLLDKEFQPSEELKEQLQAAGIELDKFIEAYKEYLKLQGKEVNSATGKQLRKNLEAAANSVLEIIEPLKQLSESNFMSGFLDSLGLGVNVAKDITAAFNAREENGGKFGLEGITSLAGAAMKVIGEVVKGIAAAKQYREEMERAATAFSRGVVENARELEIAGEKFDTIFGENLIGALDADNNALRRLNSELKNSSRTVANMKVMTRKGFWGIGRQYTSLSDLAPQLFKADGSVNYEYLDEFLDAYGDKMSESQKSLLEHLKTTYEQYQDAMEDTSEYLSNIFSDTASTIADRMMEAFAATGDAATGLGDLVNGIAKQMAKDLIQSLLVEQYLTPAIERIKALYDPNKSQFEADSVIRTQKAILTMQDAIQAAGEAVPEVNRILEALQGMGIDLNADAENASQVLSGLTEDQQNLLMSYINGIRADVSFNKGMLLSVVNSVGEMNNNIATAIVVWKQIEANTHRSADGVDRIIGFFESVMGPYDGGGGQAFRVNIA